jgi:hypothetical protein
MLAHMHLFVPTVIRPYKLNIHTVLYCPAFCLVVLFMPPPQRTNMLDYKVLVLYRNSCANENSKIGTRNIIVSKLDHPTFDTSVTKLFKTQTQNMKVKQKLYITTITIIFDK